MTNYNETNVLLNPGSIIRANLLTTDELVTDTAHISLSRSPSKESIIRLFSLLECFCLYDKLHIVTGEDASLKKMKFPTFPNLQKMKIKEERKSAAWDFFKDFGKAFGKRLLQTSAKSLYVTAVTGSPLYQLAKHEDIIKEITQDELNKSIHGVSSGMSTWQTLNELAKNVDNDDTFLWMSLSHFLKFSYVPDFTENRLVENANLSRRIPRHEIQKIYDHLSSSVKDSFESLELSAGRSIDFFIPPIPALILQKASAVKDIPHAMLDVRHDLRKVRRALREYEVIVRDSEASLKDRETAAARLVQISEVVTKDHQDRGTVTARESFLYNVLRDVAKLDPTGISDILTGEAFRGVMSIVRNRDIAYLLKLRKKYKNMKALGSLINKVFKLKITQKDIEKFDPQ